MCLPLKVLKFVGFYSGYITILAGTISLIGAFIITFTKNHSEYLQIGDGSKQGLCVSLYIFGIILINIGILGVIGRMKRSLKMVNIYNFTQFLSLITFAVLGVTSYGITNVGGITESTTLCADLEWSHDINSLVNSARKYFCKLGGCQCYVEDFSSWPSGYLFKNGITKISNHQTVNSLFDTSIQDAIKYQQCDQFHLLESDSTKYAQLVSAAEQQFNCAGWCNFSAIYLFSDLNQGIPEADEGCYQFVKKWLHHYEFLIGDICMGIVGLLAINLLFTCCLCFHPRRKINSKDIYARMAYFNE